MNKRIVDVILSGFFLLVFFPAIYIIVGSIIKITSRGPVFFKQKRTGLNGKDFVCYKFRSMRSNKEADVLQATAADPRITSFGNFMRQTHIDELPQFINVFIGDMSIIGPRPHMLAHTQYYSNLIDNYMDRHVVKPGISGWAQILSYAGETEVLSKMEDRIAADIWYINHWTPSLDLYIFYRTVIKLPQRKIDKLKTLK